MDRLPKIVVPASPPSSPRTPRRRKATYWELNQRRIKMTQHQRLARGPFQEQHPLKASFSRGDAEPIGDKVHQMEVIFQNHGPFPHSSQNNVSCLRNQSLDRKGDKVTPDHSSSPNIGVVDTLVDNTNMQKENETVSEEYFPLFNQPHFMEMEEDCDDEGRIAESEEDVPHPVEQEETLTEFKPCIKVPSVMVMKEDGLKFKGTLRIDNQSPMYYGFMIKTNTSARNIYSASPNFGSVPPLSSAEIEFHIAEPYYTQLLARHDRIVILGFGVPRRLETDVLKQYMKKMYFQYPEVVERAIVKPILEENCHSDDDAKLASKFSFNQIVHEIHGAEIIIRNIAAEIRWQKQFKQGIMVMMILLLFVVGFNSIFLKTEKRIDSNMKSESYSYKFTDWFDVY